MCEKCGEILPSQYHSKKCKHEISLSCNICHKSFTQFRYLQQHEKLHLKTTFECSICGQILKTKSNLNVHIKYMHKESSAYFQCHLCQSKFKRKYSLFKHLKIHSQKYLAT